MPAGSAAGPSLGAAQSTPKNQLCLLACCLVRPSARGHPRQPTRSTQGAHGDSGSRGLVADCPLGTWSCSSCPPGADGKAQGRCEGGVAGAPAPVVGLAVLSICSIADTGCRRRVPGVRDGPWLVSVVCSQVLVAQDEGVGWPHPTQQWHCGGCVPTVPHGVGLGALRGVPS